MISYETDWILYKIRSSHLSTNFFSTLYKNHVKSLIVVNSIVTSTETSKKWVSQLLTGLGSQIDIYKISQTLVLEPQSISCLIRYSFKFLRTFFSSTGIFLLYNECNCR